MARTSRKLGLNNHPTKKNTTGNVDHDTGRKTFNTAIYARLSVEDSGNEQRDSIKTQIDFLKNYINDKLDLLLTGIYCDNGYTGTSFRRPAWKQLLQDIQTGRVNCIVVKDLSRLGRNYIETGEYLEQVFPLLGVRFIAVNDYYDSADSNCNRESMFVALKNLVNAFYSKDISKKITSSANLKQKKGEYQGSHPPYGYLYSEEGTHKLVIDRVTAPVVKQIYDWALEGFHEQRIVSFLNDKGVPSPASYFYHLGFLHSPKYSQNINWNKSTIKRILENQLYLGHMVRAKTVESLYENIPKHATFKTDWVITKNTHEAIISEELFNLVQERKKSYSKP